MTEPGVELRTLAGALGLAAFLAGCSATPPPAATPEVPTARHWTAAAATGSPDAGPSGRPWWSEFQDPALESLVARALTANHDLAAAAAAVEAALAEARIAGADLYPTATTELAGSRSRQNFVGFPIPGRENEVLSTTSTSTGVSLNLSWEADLWGRLRASKGAAVAQVEAAVEDLEAARLSLAAQTAKAWFAAREAAAQVALARRTLDNRRSTRERVRRRYALGLRGSLDLRLAVADAASSEAEVTRRERQLDSALRQLRLLLAEYPHGDPPPELEPLLDGGSTPRTLLVGPLPPVPIGLPAEVVTRRPDLRAAERRLATAGLSIRAARAALYPQLRLTASAGRLSSDVEDLLRNDFSVWRLATSILQPLFQGGRLRAGVRLAEARYRQAAELYAQTVLQAFSEVEQALVAERSWARVATALRQAVDQALAARTLAEDRYDAGLEDYLAVLEAQQQAAAAESRLFEAERALLTARVDLHLALGGDLETPPTAPPPETIEEADEPHDRRLSTPGRSQE